MEEVIKTKLVEGKMVEYVACKECHGINTKLTENNTKYTCECGYEGKVKVSLLG